MRIRLGSVLAVVIASGTAAPVWAQCALQDFESYADGTLVGATIPGLTFESYDVTGTCSSFPEIMEIGGNNVVGTGFDSDPLCFSNPQDLYVSFDAGQESVTLSVGAATSGSVGLTVRAYSTAFGFAGEQDSVSLTLTSGTALQSVTLVRNTADIVRVRVTAGVSASEIVDDISFVDGTAPTAVISAPGLMSCACDLVSVAGLACDPEGTYSSDQLEYVRIDPPDDNTWKLIGSAAAPLCSTGTLYNWDTTGPAITEGLYRLRLRVFNDCGGQSDDYGTVYVDKDFDTISVRTPVAGGVYGGTVCFDGSIGDARCFQDYQVEASPAGVGSYGPVDPASPVYTTSVSSDPFAYWDTVAAGVPDGDYDVRITGNTHCRTRVEPPMRITIDNKPAVAVIDSPVMCSQEDGLIEFYGTASDAHFTSYRLELFGGPYRQWTTFWTSGTAVEGGFLGALDPQEFNLSPCCYAVRLRVSTSVQMGCNLGTQVSADHVTVRVGSGGGACAEDIDGDGAVGLSDLAMVLAAFGISCP